MSEDDSSLLDVVRRAACAQPAVARSAQERAARRAIHRWLASEESASLAGTQDGCTPARAMLVRRLDECLRELPLHKRTALQSRIIAARARLLVAQGAGAERAIASAVHRSTVEEILDEIEAIATRPSAARNPVSGRKILALLLLLNASSQDADAVSVTRLSTVRPPPAAPRSAACSGTAATR